MLLHRVAEIMHKVQKKYKRILSTRESCDGKEYSNLF